MTWTEGVVLGLALGGMLVVVQCFLRKSLRLALLTTLLCAPALYLAAEHNSQFATADEKSILRDILTKSSPNIWSQWVRGALRTSMVVLGPAAMCMTSGSTDPLPDSVVLPKMAMLKNMHWLGGGVLSMALLWMIGRAWPALRRPEAWILLTYGVLLLPVHLMAWRIFNYDEFALLFSMLALLCVVIALQGGPAAYGYLAVLFGYLGAQEKLSAAPFLVLAIAVFFYLRLHRPLRILHLVYAAVAPLAISVSIGTLSLVIALQLYASPPDSARQLWLGVLDPFNSWVWVVHRFVYGGTNFNAYVWVHLAVSVLTCLVGALALLLVTTTMSRPMAAPSAKSAAAAIRFVLLLVVFAAGTWGTFGVQAYWHPYHPIAADEFRPGGAFNGVILHFASHSYRQHLCRAIGFHYAVFLNSFPTILLLMSAITLFARLTFCRRTAFPLAFDVIAGTCLMVPLGWALLSMPFGHRYFNFTLLPYAMISCVDFILLLNAGPRWRMRLLGAVACLGLLAEIAAAAPIYFQFRPIWSAHHYADAKIPAPGRLNPTWLGWGEESMLAGEILDGWVKQGRTPPGESRPVLYVMYYCDWLNPSPRLEVKPLRAYVQQLQYTPWEYYLINRSSFVQRDCPFPENVPAEFVIAHRGFVQAWIFRGDKLKAAGYQF